MTITVIQPDVVQITLQTQQGPAGASTVTALLAAEDANQSRLAAQQSAQESADSAVLAETSAQDAETSAQDAFESRQIVSAAADRAESAADSAEISKNISEDILEEFRGAYLGSFASDPLLDNNGQPLLIGALYYNTTLPQLKVYTANAWETAYFGGGDVVIESELQQAFFDHEQETDPHPQYTTVAEAAAAAPVQFSFRNVLVAGQGSVVADLPEDNLTLIAGDNIIITTNSMNDSITITSTAQAVEASIAVFDEGTLITSGATHLRFTGDGVSATATSGDVTVNIPKFNAFAVVTGNTGTATADSNEDSLSITGGVGISTQATDTPDGLVITNTDRGSTAVSTHESATDPHPQYTTIAEAAAAAPVQVSFQTVSGNTGSAVADTATDTLSILGTDGISVSANATTDTLTIQATFATANTIQPDASASAGTAQSFARSDHRHAISADVAVALGSTAAEGTSQSFARADHVHPFPTAVQVGAASASFTNILVSGQPTVVADSTSDTLTLVAGTNITITTDSLTDSITINSTSGGGGTLETSSAANIAFITLGGY